MGGSFVPLYEKKELEQYLRKNIYLHIYSIGDLDDFFWPYTAWYGLKTRGELDAVILIYTGQPLPVLLALSEEIDRMRELLGVVSSMLPHHFYAHFSPGLESILGPTHSLESQGEFCKMALRDTRAVLDFPSPDAVPLCADDEEEVQAFYTGNCPGNWFDPRMLQTDQYFGVRVAGRLISIAGIHVFSPRHRVAALGNIATLGSFRGRGFGKQVTAKVCRSLLEKVDHIGLNVRSDNDAAIACYQRLGFEIIASYREFMVRKNEM
jgi:ribosomal protein S18 acetylase RimI-like enzyme